MIDYRKRIKKQKDRGNLQISPMRSTTALRWRQRCALTSIRLQMVSACKLAHWIPIRSLPPEKTRSTATAEPVQVVQALEDVSHSRIATHLGYRGHHGQVSRGYGMSPIKHATTREGLLYQKEQALLSV